MNGVIIYFAAVIIVAFLALFVKEVRPDFGLCVTLAGVLFLFYGIFPRISLLIGDIRSFSETSGFRDDYIAAVLKIIGITYLCEFASDICADAGEVSLSKQVETLGKITVAYIALPIVEDVFSLILDLLR